MRNQYDKGDLVRVTATFTSPSGAAVDPTGVVFRLKRPDGTTTVYTYGTDAQLVRDAVGVYRVDVSADQPNMYYYRFEGTGANQAAAEGEFDVLAGRF